MFANVCLKHMLCMHAAQIRFLTAKIWCKEANVQILTPQEEGHVLEEGAEVLKGAHSIDGVSCHCSSGYEWSLPAASG